MTDQHCCVVCEFGVAPTIEIRNSLKDVIDVVFRWYQCLPTAREDGERVYVEPSSVLTASHTNKRHV